MHGKKMIAPIVVTILLISYYLVFFGIWIHMVETGVAWLLGIVPLAIIGLLIYVCRQRIQEIRSGEEDDLSKY